MIMFNYLVYLIKMLFYPLRLILFTVHRFLVFLSKPGARIILPVLMLSVGFLLRSRIDALAGGLITDAFWDYRDSSPEVFDYRIEITFGLCFFAAYVALLIAAKVTTPVVGAVPAPRAPLFPRPPLIVREHKIDTVRTSVAISGGKSRFKGQLERLDRHLPPPALAVLGAGASVPDRSDRAPGPTKQPERDREDPAPAREPLQPVQAERNRSQQSAKETKPKRKEGSAAPAEAPLQVAVDSQANPAAQTFAEDLPRRSQTTGNGPAPTSEPKQPASEPAEVPPVARPRSNGPRRPPRQAAKPPSNAENEKEGSPDIPAQQASSTPRRSRGPARPPRQRISQSEQEP